MAFLSSLTAEASRVLADPSLAAFVGQLGGAVEAYVAATAKGGAAFIAGPAQATFGVCLLAAYSCYQYNVWTTWWSAVDRCWSVLPAVYALIYALWPLLAGAGAIDARLALMAALVTLWGARLTYNFARKGGYSPGVESEDYRWPILRAFFKAHDPTHPLGEQLFSLLFVALYQQILIWLFVVPPFFVAARHAATPLGATDALLAVAFLALLAGETWADEAQFAFQKAKHAMSPAERERAGGDFARGFLSSTAPFTYSRHLNFFCEQSLWVVIYLFSWSAGAELLNWSGFGAALLISLFQGSTWMTELVSAQKYPAYKAYQQTTSRLMPWFAGPSLDAPAGKLILKNKAAAADGAAVAASGASKRRKSIGGKRE